MDLKEQINKFYKIQVFKKIIIRKNNTKLFVRAIFILIFFSNSVRLAPNEKNKIKKKKKLLTFGGRFGVFTKWGRTGAKDHSYKRKSGLQKRDDFRLKEFYDAEDAKAFFCERFEKFASKKKKIKFLHLLFIFFCQFSHTHPTKFIIFLYCCPYCYYCLKRIDGRIVIIL